MALTASETLVKSAGDVYIHTSGTAAPADDGLDDTTLTTAGWTSVGWIGEGSLQLEGFETTVQKYFGWNRKTAIRTGTENKEPTVKLELLQWTVENLTLFFPGATYDAPTKTLSIPDDGTATEQAVLVVVRDGDAKDVAVWLSRTSPRGDGAVAFPDDGPASLPVAFDVLAPDSGDPYAFVNVDAAA